MFCVTGCVYRYLLKGLPLGRPNHVWATYLTHTPVRRGFLYLATIMDRRTGRYEHHPSDTRSQTLKVSRLGVKTMGIGDTQLTNSRANPPPDVLLEPLPRALRGAHFPRP